VGIFVVVLLLAAGAVYVATQGSDSADGKDGKTKSAKATKPGEIEVTVLNGTAVPGLAAKFGDKVEGKGFQLGAVTNSSTSFAESIVMFERGHAPEARKVAKALDISQLKLMSADIESVSGGASVSVIVGEDNAASEG
jgi:LytR cell envelope-related transcriptional attenuator